MNNEGAKFSSIRKSSDEPDAAKILLQMTKEALNNQGWAWYTRVPSYSNPSDPATRLEHDIMLRVFEAKRILVN